MSEEIKIIAFKFFKSVELDGKYYKRIGETKLETIQHGWINLKYLFEYRKLLKFAVRKSWLFLKRKFKSKMIRKVYPLILVSAGYLHMKW
jgi:hypothetical protein